MAVNDQGKLYKIEASVVTILSVILPQQPSLKCRPLLCVLQKVCPKIDGC